MSDQLCTKEQTVVALTRCSGRGAVRNPMEQCINEIRPAKAAYISVGCRSAASGPVYDVNQIHEDRGAQLIEVLSHRTFPGDPFIHRRDEGELPNLLCVVARVTKSRSKIWTDERYGRAPLIGFS